MEGAGEGDEVEVVEVGEFPGHPKVTGDSAHRVRTHIHPKQEAHEPDPQTPMEERRETQILEQEGEYLYNAHAGNEETHPRAFLDGAPQSGESAPDLADGGKESLFM